MPSYLVSAKESFVPTEMYTPPIQSIGEIMRIKQGRYDQGFERVNSAYNNIKNTEYVRSADGRAKQAQYISQAENALKDLSAKDLSLPENVKTAEDVFRPFWEDKDLVREIGMVKSGMSELEYGESLRLSTDEKKRAEYNTYSIQDLNNYLFDIENSTAEERRNMQPRRYVKKVDVISEMDKTLKDLGIQDAQVIEEPNGGGYKVVDKFGQKSVLPLLDIFRTSLSTDARDYLQMMGRLNYHTVYRGQLEKFQGDKIAARNAIAGDLLEQEKTSLGGNIIPELESAAKDVESKIAAVIARRKAQNSDLSQEDMQLIESYKQAYSNYNTKLNQNKTRLKNLDDVNSDDYKETMDNLRINAPNFYSRNAIDQYAMGWAKSRSNILSSKKVEADQTWNNAQNLINDRLNLQSKYDIANMNNASDEFVAQMKANASGKGGSSTGATKMGSNATGQGGFYLSQNPTGNQVISKAEQHTRAVSEAFNMYALPLVSYFETNMSEATGIGTNITGKLYKGLAEGKTDEPFFTSEDARNGNPDYKTFSAALNAKKIGATGKNYGRLTYGEVFNILSDSALGYMKSAEGIEKFRQNGTKEVAELLRASDNYAALKKDQERVKAEIFSDKSYTGYTTTQGGAARLKTASELAADQVVTLVDQSGKPKTVKLSEVVANRGSITPFGGQRRIGGGFNEFAQDVVTKDNGAMVTINGVKYTTRDRAVSYFAGDNSLADYAKNYLPEQYKKLEQLKTQYNAQFERLAPSLLSTQQNNANAANFGWFRYQNVDEKNMMEGVEVAAQQLLSPENMTNRYDKFVGVDKRDLQEGSDFMKVVTAVRGILPELNKNNNLTVDVSSYDTQTGGPVYKINVQREDIIKALGISKDDLTPDLNKAIDKFTSDSFKIVAPTYNGNPGGLINALSPIESQVLNGGGYTTPSFLDEMKMGGFNVKKLSDGNFLINAHYYDMNPQTGALEKRSINPVKAPGDRDVLGMIDNMYNLIQTKYNQVTKVMQSKPPVQKGSGTSTDAVVEQLKQLGINIK